MFGLRTRRHHGPSLEQVLDRPAVIDLRTPAEGLAAPLAMTTRYRHPEWSLRVDNPGPGTARHLTVRVVAAVGEGEPPRVRDDAFGAHLRPKESLGLSVVTTRETAPAMELELSWRDARGRHTRREVLSLQTARV